MTMIAKQAYTWNFLKKIRDNQWAEEVMKLFSPVFEQKPAA
jgi:hypothetical protein